MALMCSLAACSSGENSNGSAHTDVSHGSAVSTIHQDPIVADVAKVPLVAEVKEEHLVPDPIDEPGVSDVKQDPVGLKLGSSLWCPRFWKIPPIQKLRRKTMYTLAT